MDLLRLLPEDATYYAWERVREISERKSKFRDCIDLKNFTDFLPISLQKVVVEQIFGTELAEQWKSIMTVPVWDGQKFIRYTKGQPMGLLSSWAVATLTHHFLIRWSAGEVKYKGKYFILGDDNVILDKELSQCYTSMLERLNIPESKGKRLTSENGSFEFCKRLIWNGDKEITPLPWNSLDAPKIQRFLEVRRILLSRLQSDPLLDVIIEELFPDSLTDSEIASLRLYISLIDSTALSSEPVTQFDPGTSPYISARITKSALKVSELADDVGEMVRFRPEKANVRLRRSISKHKIRGVVDEATQALYWHMLHQYLKLLDSELTLWSRRTKYAVGTGAVYVGGRLKWNAADFENPKKVNFYKLDPKGRFSDIRQQVHDKTLQHITKQLKLSGKIESTDPKDSLKAVEIQISASAMRRMNDTNLYDRLLVKGKPVSIEQMKAEVKNKNETLVPGLFDEIRVESEKVVEYDFDSDEEFGG